MCLLLVSHGWIPSALAQQEQPMRPILLSPGSANAAAALVDRACPTFSWSGVAGAQQYEIVVHDASDPEGELPVVLRRTLPAGVSSFTLATGECLEDGARYAWLVRAEASAGESWSAPALFEIESRRQSELASTLERAADLMDQLERLDVELAAEMARVGIPNSTGRADSEESGTVGVASAMAMPLMAVNNRVQADFLLGTAPSLTGVTAVDLSCFFCVSGTDIGDNEVTGLDIPFGAVGFSEIVDDAVRSEKIVDGSIQTSHLADGAVHFVDFAVGSVGASELADQSVLVDKIGPRMKRVECNGECGDAVLGDVCGTLGVGPIAVFSPHSVPDPGGATSTCGGDNQCRLLTQLSPSTSLGALCPDGGGWDCIVVCA